MLASEVLKRPFPVDLPRLLAEAFDDFPAFLRLLLPPWADLPALRLPVPRLPFFLAEGVACEAAGGMAGAEGGLPFAAFWTLWRRCLRFPFSLA